jgi:DNA-binding XRE family transcriptional regulator
MRCFKCKSENSYRPWEGPAEVMGVKFVARGDQCANCEEILFTPEQSREHDRLVARGIVERGARTGAELRLLRKVAGLTAAELAALLDVTPETVSRWENDRVPTPITTSYVVGDLVKQPKRTRKRLEALRATG